MFIRRAAGFMRPRRSPDGVALPDVVPKQRGGEPARADPVAMLRSRPYVGVLVLAAILGVPIASAAYFFLALISHAQTWVFTDLPKGVGFDSEPLWWPFSRCSSRAC